MNKVYKISVLNSDHKVIASTEVVCSLGDVRNHQNAFLKDVITTTGNTRLWTAFKRVR